MKLKKVKRLLFAQVGLLIVLLFVWVTPAMASNNIWYDKYIALENSIGNNYYSSNDSATLAWTESWMLTSYLDLYSLTKSTSWLDKMVTHIDTIIANADDIDNDGYLGWSSATYSPVELQNWDFEDATNPDDSFLPDHWTRYQATEQTVARTSDHPNTDPDNHYGVQIETNGTQWQALKQPLIKYEPDTTYVLRFYGKTNGSAAKGRAYLKDATTNSILCEAKFENTSWQLIQQTCRTPVQSGHTLEIWLLHQDYTVTGGSAYFDDVKISGKFPNMVHDGMVGTAIAKFARLIQQTPALQSAYLTKASSYRSFLESNIVPRWENSSYIGNTWVPISTTPGQETGVYKQPSNFDSLGQTWWTTLPYNQYLAYTNMLLILNELNGNSTYLERATWATRYFKNHIFTNGTGYKWDYAIWNSTTPEDTSHANVDLDPIFEMYKRGILFTSLDMDKFANSLTDFMWNQSLTSPTVARYVTGLSPTDLRFTKLLMYWTELAQYDKRIFTIASEQYRNYTPGITAELLTLARIMKWDRAKLVNQGFELTTAADATQPAQWNRVNSTSSTAYLDSTNKYEGNYGLAIKANGTTAQQMNQTWEGWTASTSYTLSFMGKTDGTAAGGKVYVKNETTGATIASLSFTDTSWTAKSFTFTSPSSSSDVVRVYIGNNNISITNGNAYFDNIKIKATADSW